MDTQEDVDNFRLVALCQRMGRLWTDQEIEDWQDEPPLERVEECKLMLVGKILSNPSINFQALQNMLKMAWRTEQVEFTQWEAGTYVVKFQSESEKNRILEGGPWRFSSHLIIFQPWKPNTPLHCYEFNTCPLWVQVYGLPLEWCTEDMLRKMWER